MAVRDPAWDQWFSDQYDLTDNIRAMVKERTKNRSEAFKAAVIFAIIETLAEDVRSHLTLLASDANPISPDGDQ